MFQCTQHYALQVDTNTTPHGYLIAMVNLVRYETQNIINIIILSFATTYYIAKIVHCFSIV